MQPHTWITVLWNFILLPALLANAKDACVNMYDRYCELLSPEKCYYSYNQKLCCATCLYYNELYAYAETREDPCYFGDRKAGCDAQPSDLCYKRSHRKNCCGTCARHRLDLKHCEYGDKKVHECKNVQQYMCYAEDVEQKCCGSCARHHTGRKDCAYGDRIMFFSKNRKKYSCPAYVGHFGHARCRFPWDPSFRQICCGSCHNSFSKFDYYK